MTKPSSINHKVYQHNKLIEASHTLSLNEKRLVLYAASRLDSRKPMPKDERGFIKIDASSFAEVFGLDLKSVYTALADASRLLFHREIKLFNPQGKLVEQVRWVYHVKYHEGAGMVELGFSPSIEPYLTRLHKEFTYFQLKQVGSLESFYAIRLYELCAQFRNTKDGSRHVTVESMRQMLDMGDKYKSVKDFRRWVLEPSVKGINANTDLQVEYETIRKGRKVTGYIFHIARKEPSKVDMEKSVGEGGVSDENA